MVEIGELIVFNFVHLLAKGVFHIPQLGFVYVVFLNLLTMYEWYEPGVH